MSIILGLTQQNGCGGKAPAAGEKFLHFLEKKCGVFKPFNWCSRGKIKMSGGAQAQMMGGLSSPTSCTYAGNTFSGHTTKSSIKLKVLSTVMTARVSKKPIVWAKLVFVKNQ